MSNATLTQSNCESTVGDAIQPVERNIQTYLERIRSTYGDELHRHTYMYDDDQLQEARTILQDLLKAEEDPDRITAIYAARACVITEIQRRYRRT